MNFCIQWLLSAAKNDIISGKNGVDAVFYYEGLSCPVCSKRFQENDDVVVCPQCGLPHHRECWKTIGRCFEEENHGTEQQWSRERDQSKVPPSGNEKSVMQVCPHCGTQNAEYAEFCARCAYPLNVEDWHSAPQQYAPFAGEYTPFGQPYESYSSVERIGTSNAADLAAVVGNNTRYYIDRFRRIERNGSGGWNWAAFLLAPIWLFYRKQYGLGVLYLALQLMSNLATAVMYAPIQLAETQAAAEAALTEIVGGSMFTFAAILSLIFLVLQILLGIRANHFYLRHCEKKIAKARENVADISVTELAAVGGVSVGVAVLVYVLSSVVLDMISLIVASQMFT